MKTSVIAVVCGTFRFIGKCPDRLIKEIPGSQCQKHSSHITKIFTYVKCVLCYDCCFLLLKRSLEEVMNPLLPFSRPFDLEFRDKNDSEKVRQLNLDFCDEV